LDERELELLEAGPAAYGWDADQRWTLEQVCGLVAERFGVRYTLKGMSLVLHRLGWSVQAPAHRAAERDEAAIAAWVREAWPTAKRPRATWVPGWSSRTNRARAQAAQDVHLGPARAHPGDRGARTASRARHRRRPGLLQTRARLLADLPPAP
jgi:Winged helix-turn helix